MKRRIARKNVRIILCLLFLISALYTALVSMHRAAYFTVSRVPPYYPLHQSNNGSEHSPSTTSGPQLTRSKQEVANELLRVYEQQVSYLATAPFLPTYENHRLKFKLNTTSIAMYLYGAVGNIKVPARQLRIVCLAKSVSNSTVHDTLSIILNFAIKSVRGTQVKLALRPETLAMYSSITSTAATHIKIDPPDTITFQLQRKFPVDTLFSFTYQWTDSKGVSALDWPQWPFPKSCVDRIKQNIARERFKHTQANHSCLMTALLKYSSSQQLFAAERTTIIHWLDTQYDAFNSYPSFNAHKSRQAAESQVETKARRRLSPFETSLDSSVCSPEFNDWVFAYEQWHQNVTANISPSSMTIEQQRDRILNLDLRFLLYENPRTGVADRIVHLMTTYLVALLTNRLFLFGSNWPEFLDTIRSTLNFEQQWVIPWVSRLHILNANLSPNHSKYITSRSSSFSYSNFNQDYDYNREFPERILTFHGDAGNIVHLMNSNTSIYHRFLTKDLRMSPEKMFGCLYHSLFVHRLAALIQRTSGALSIVSINRTLGYSAQQILQILLSPIFFPIGIQVRTGDKRMAYNMSARAAMGVSDETIIAAFQNYFSCAQGIATEHQELRDLQGQLPVGFLLSDASLLRQAALKRWQLPASCLHTSYEECYNRTHQLSILANPDPVFHVSRTSQVDLAFQLAMFDIFLFGFCERHVISTHSGFGRFAVFASLRQRNVHSLNILESSLCRAENQGISLIDSAYDWSGI